MNDKLHQLQLSKLVLSSVEQENVHLKFVIGDYEHNFPEKASKLLSNIFSETQIKMIMNPKGKVKQWSPEDIASSITLRSVSPKAYCYLRDKLNFPLPGIL